MSETIVESDPIEELFRRVSNLEKELRREHMYRQKVTLELEEKLIKETLKVHELEKEIKQERARYSKLEKRLATIEEKLNSPRTTVTNDQIQGKDRHHELYAENDEFRNLSTCWINRKKDISSLIKSATFPGIINVDLYTSVSTSLLTPIKYDNAIVRDGKVLLKLLNGNSTYYLELLRGIVPITCRNGNYTSESDIRVNYQGNVISYNNVFEHLPNKAYITDSMSTYYYIDLRYPDYYFIIPDGMILPSPAKLMYSGERVARYDYCYYYPREYYNLLMKIFKLKKRRDRDWNNDYPDNLPRTTPSNLYFMLGIETE
jgi:hypothetical protein